MSLIEPLFSQLQSPEGLLAPGHVLAFCGGPRLHNHALARFLAPSFSSSSFPAATIERMLIACQALYSVLYFSYLKSPNLVNKPKMQASSFLYR